MMDVVFCFSLVYILFSFLTMNTLIIQCFVDNTVRPTIKKGVVAFFVFFVLLITGGGINSGTGGAFALVFVYFVYPIIMIWEKNKKLSSYRMQVCTFIACEVVTIVGNIGIYCSVLLWDKEPSLIFTTVTILIMGSLYNFVSVRLYMKYIRYGIAMLYGKKEGIMVLLYTVISVFTMTVFISSAGENIRLEVSVCLRIMAIILLLMIPLMMKKDRENIYYMEQSFKNAHFLEMQLMAYNTYKEAQEDTRAFRHDINNNLAFISMLMQEKKYDEAEKYVKELNGNIAALSQKVVTGDDMLDTLILSKLSLIKNNNIKFVIKGVIAGGLGWKAIDVCTVFSNLIDNAVEACQKIENIQNRYIEISFRQANLQRIITVKNTVNYNLDYTKINANIKYTTKTDKENHGYGLQNIRNVIEKNNAMVQMKCDGAYYETDIIIMKG